MDNVIVELDFKLEGEDSISFLESVESETTAAQSLKK
jgi:hypothetical protein